MKKILLTMVFAITLYFIPAFSVMASNLDCTSQQNGVIQVALNSDQGYALAVDTTIQLQGDVTLQKVEWDSSLLPSYVKRYVYDEANKTIRIYIATGNMDHNLVDSNGRIPLVTITVTGQEGASYYFEVQKLSVSNMDYESLVVSDLSNEDYQEFVYGGSPANSFGSNQNEGSNFSSGSNSSLNNLDQEGENADSVDGELSDSNLEKDNRDKSKDQNGVNDLSLSTNQKQKMHGFKWNFSIVLIIIGVVILLFIGVFFLKRKKSNEKK